MFDLSVVRCQKIKEMILKSEQLSETEPKLLFCMNQNISKATKAEA